MINYKEALEVFHYDRTYGKIYWKVWKYKQVYPLREVGSIGNRGYRKFIFKKKVYLTHRIIWLLETRKLPITLDHINGDRLDNRFENLREAEQGVNQKNRKIPKNNTSGTQGITWCKLSKKWKVQAFKNKKHYYFGLFESLKEAELVAKNAYKILGFHPNHGRKSILR